jgi:hypothetical protein
VAGSDPLLVRSLDAGEALEAYRIVATEDAGSTEMADRFTSSFARERPPRGLERRSVVVQMGISLFERPEQAAAVAQQFPVIGGFIAVVRTESKYGFCWADTGPPGHMTVWGRRLQSVAGIVDISDVASHG